MELKQPRRRRRQERHKYPYLRIKDFSYACLALAFFIFEHFICPSRPFDGVKSVVLHLYGRRERT